MSPPRDRHRARARHEGLTLGAQGGVCWLHLNSIENATVGRLRRALAPWFDELTRRGGGSYDGDLSRAAWMREHPEALVIGSWGTDVSRGVEWGELGDFLDDVCDALTAPGIALGDTATFRDLLLEQETRPTWLHGAASAPAGWMELLRAHDGPLLDTALVAWLDEIDALTGLAPWVERIETWT